MADAKPTRNRAPRVKLTPQYIEALQPKPKRYRVLDAQERGLAVVVMPSGTKAWHVRYTADGETRTYVLGDAEVVRPGEARKRAAKAKAGDQQGEKIAKRQQAKEAKAEKVLSANRTLAAFLREKYEPKHLRQMKSGNAIHARICHVWSGLMSKDMRDITSIDVRDVVNARRANGREVGTLRRDLGALKALFAAAREHGDIDQIPVPTFKNLSLPTPDARKRYLGERDKDEHHAKGERQRFLEALEAPETSDHLRVIVKLLMNTGLRRGEALTLRWKRVDLVKRTLTVDAALAKTAKTREVALNDQAVAVLRDWRRQAIGDAEIGPGFGEQLLFPSRLTGRAFTTLKTAWRSLVKRAEVEDFRLHDVRHDYATRLAATGIPLVEVQKQLGHFSVTMTEKYTHPTGEGLDAALNKIGVL